MPDSIRCENCGFDAREERKLRLCDQISPYQFLIGSKIRLPEAESGRTEIKNHIEILQNELKESQSRLDRLRSAVLATEVDCAALLGTINGHISINPPVHDLPVELLEHILLLSYDTPFDLLDTVAGRPWVLARVCRRWKRTVLESAAIWSSFRTLYSPQRCFVFNTEELASRCIDDALTRSRQMPLIIELDTKHPFIPFDAISAHASRLQKLSILSTMESLSKIKWTPGDLVSLTSLRLCIFYSREDLFPFDISDAPKLTHLSLHSRQGMPSSLQFPYIQLTDLEIRLSRSTSDFMSTRFILSQCSNLVRFVDRTPPPDRNISSSVQPLVLRSLAEITVLSPRSLSGLSCPNLKVFGAMDTMALEFKGDNVFTRFLQSVEHPLHKLRLGFECSDFYNRRSTDMTLNSGLASIAASLIHLDMNLHDGGSDRWDWFADILAYEPHRRSKALVAPHLESLKLSVEWYYRSPLNESCVESVLGAIIPRWELPAGQTTMSKLRSVEIVLTFSIDDDGKYRYGYDLSLLTFEELWGDFKENELYLELRKLEEEGLELAFHGDVKSRDFED